MKRKLLLISAAAVFVMALNFPVYGGSVTLTQGQSMTFTFSPSGFPNTSALATVTLNGSLLTINLTNSSTDGTTRIKGIGLNTTPDLNVIGFSATGGMSAFSFSTGGGGLGNMEAVASSSGRNTLNQGSNNSGSVAFTLATAPAFLNIDQITVHFISLPNGDSIKVNGMNGGEIPEPASMLLLGTGLAGAAGAFRRRRKVSKQ